MAQPANVAACGDHRPQQAGTGNGWLALAVRRQRAGHPSPSAWPPQAAAKLDVPATLLAWHRRLGRRRASGVGARNPSALGVYSVRSIRVTCSRAARSLGQTASIAASTRAAGPTAASTHNASGGMY